MADRRRRSVAGSCSSSYSSSPSKFIPRPGRLKRLKNKLSVIFHHHHHHHHHHHRSNGGTDDDTNGDATPPNDRAHRSFWRYIRKAVHRKPEPGNTVGKIPARRREHGYLHSLMESFLRHVWRRSRKRGDAALSYRKSLRRIGESLRTGKETKVGLWQNLQRRGGVKLENRKKPRIAMGGRRSHKKS